MEELHILRIEGTSLGYHNNIVILEYDEEEVKHIVNHVLIDLGITLLTKKKNKTYKYIRGETIKANTFYAERRWVRDRLIKLNTYQVKRQYK